MKRERERIRRTRWQPGGGGKNKKCHLSGNAEVVPVFESSKKVVPLFEREKRSCHYLIITLKVVPLYDVNPFYYDISATLDETMKLINAVIGADIQAIAVRREMTQACHPRLASARKCPPEEQS